MATIALHGDFGTAKMLQCNVGDLASSVDYFFPAGGWVRFEYQFRKLLTLIASLSEPPILIGYSRGGSVIAKLSEVVAIKAAVLYESPVIDSEGVGGVFPVLMIWNDEGAKYGRDKVKRGQAKVSEEIWSEKHPVTPLTGTGHHFGVRPPRHCWDVSLNDQIREFLSA